MAYYRYNPNAKVGEPWHQMTMRELYTELHKLMQNDSANPQWDNPIDVRLWESEALTAYKFSVEDITDACEGSCQHPQCVYAVTDPALVAKFENGEDVPGYLDEGLHFAPTLWLNK